MTLPITFGPCSNGEYDPVNPGPVERAAFLQTLADTQANARRTGVSRRQFLRSLCGVATALVALDACSRRSAPRGRPPGGTYQLPPESTVNPDAARSRLAGNEVVVDLQTHLLEGPRSDSFGRLFPQSSCGDGNCFSIEHHLELVFLESDTSLAVLSAIPVVGADGPLSPAVMQEARRVADAACRDSRLLLHGHVTPTVGSVPSSLEAMEAAARSPGVVAWKAYTHAGGRPWWLDDHDPDVPRVGEAFIRKAVELGVPRICVHKGFGGGSPYASPVDVGPAARAHPDVSFVIYHSGYDTVAPEGPYAGPDNPQGIDRLIASMQRSGLGPGSNVYAELGSTWWSVMRSPDQAAHVLGKLLKHVGEDNVVWGTDSIWYGSPQSQIQAFRAFEISAEYQERFGYPALTPGRKAKILGANALRMHGMKPPGPERCQFTRAQLEEIRQQRPAPLAAHGPRTASEAAAVRASDWAWTLPA